MPRLVHRVANAGSSISLRLPQVQGFHGPQGPLIGRGSPDLPAKPAQAKRADLRTLMQLATVWGDPQFDPTEPAVYYLRVLEIPTPRWSTILAVERGTPLPPDLPATIQERGWTSPIWYTPVASAPWQPVHAAPPTWPL
jgi:hypothetical protein